MGRWFDYLFLKLPRTLARLQLRGSRWLVAIIAGVLGLSLMPAIGAKPVARPHIVVFLADDFSFLDSEVYGGRDVRAPNMVRLAAAGITFTGAFVASPSCAPSRAALLTGDQQRVYGSPK